MRIREGRARARSTPTPSTPSSPSGPPAGAALAPSLVSLSLAAILLATSGPLRGQQGMEDVEIVAHHAAGSVYMLSGRGGNIGVSVGEDGVLLVDDQFAPLAGRIRRAVGEIAPGGEPDPEVTFVLNTHWHGDHTGGNEVFGREAHIVAHEAVRRRLSTEQRIRGQVVEPKPPEALPVVTFESSVSIHFNGEEIEVIHAPEGHTDGDAIVWFTGSNVVHMGDQMFAGRFPFVDLASGGSVQGYLRNVAGVLDRVPEDAVIVPGHGPMSDVEGLRRFHEMLEETVAIVRDRIESGMSLEEATEAGLPDRWSSWGEGFISTEQWIETVYRSYSPDTALLGEAAWHPHGHGSAHGHEPAHAPAHESAHAGIHHGDGDPESGASGAGAHGTHETNDGGDPADESDTGRSRR